MILVIGAGGTVGTAVHHALRARGETPRLAYRSPEKAARAKSAGRDAVLIDYGRPETLRPVMDGIDAVFLLGAGAHGQIEGETNVVSAAKAAGVKRIVKLSVWQADTEGYSFAKLHRAVERVLEASGLETTMLRPNGFMQNFSNYMAGSIGAQGAFHQPAAHALVSHIDVRDIAAVAALVLTEPGHAGKVYELSGPKALSYAEAADILSRTLGKPIGYVPVSDAAAKAGMLSAGIPELYADMLIDLSRFYREGGSREVTTTVPDLLGRQAIAFEQFARDHVGAFT